MARRKLTKELYDLLAAGFREAPGNATNAGRIAGCDPRTARRAWREGWGYSWAPPIRELIRQEMELARIERAKLAEQERDQQIRDRKKAREDASRAAGEEAQAATIARANSIAAGALIQSLMRSMMPLTKKLQEALLEGGDLKPREMAKMLGDAAYIVRQGNEAIKSAFELERLRVGEPTQILGVTGMDANSPEEVAVELQGLGRALSRALRQQKVSSRSLVEGPDGTFVVDLPEDAFEEETAEVVPIKKKAGTKR